MQFYWESEDEEIADKIPEVLYNLSGKIIQAELEGKIRSCCTWLLSYNVSQNYISSYKNIFNTDATYSRAFIFFVRCANCSHKVALFNTFANIHKRRSKCRIILRLPKPCDWIHVFTCTLRAEPFLCCYSIIKRWAHYTVARQLTAHAQWKQNTNGLESIFSVGEENWLWSQGRRHVERKNITCKMAVYILKFVCFSLSFFVQHKLYRENYI